MTTSVMCAAAIAAKEGRKVVTADIKGAFLNSSMEPTGVRVHMRLDKDMTKILVKIDPSYAEFVEPDGSSVVELDKVCTGRWRQPSSGTTTSADVLSTTWAS